MDQNLEVNLSFGESMGVPFDNSVDISDHQDHIIIDAPGNDIPMEFETVEEHPALMETAAEETIIPEFLSEQYTLEDNINYVEEHPVLEASTSANDTSGISIHTPASSVYGVVPTQTQYVRIKPQVSQASRAPPPRPVAIAPKPRPPRPALAGKPVKTVSIGNLLPGQKGTVLAQIGKQLVLVAPGGGTSADKKPRFVQAPPHIQAQIMQAKNAAGSIKPLFGKVIVQGTGLSALSARDSDSGAAAGTVGGASHNVIFASPTKHGPRFSKSPQKVVITKQPGVPTTKKVVITANPQQNFVLKNTLPTKIVSQASGTAAGRTQIHQVNVPGKGVQYIKLVTNPKPITIKPAPAPSGKTIVFDTKVNFIGNQNQPIVVTTGPSGGKVMAKPQQKLVRIAPLGSKTVPINSIVTSVRGGQSLLAPRGPSPPPPPPPPHDSKEALRVLIENAVRESPHKPAPYDAPEPTVETTIGSESPQAERPLIVVPAADNAVPSKVKRSFSFNIDENSNQNTLELSRSPPPESDNGELELDKLRARKACNCTKSQCLKLYCDCFANGEFCYRCNCTNCHNNLDNEELRQKAIRGCLERNPNAFRPKIGKANNTTDPIPIRRHNKGCNCKRSGCLKNYCECYEAKIACSAMCKCVGCRNVTDVARRRPPPPPAAHTRQPCSFMTVEVIEAVCQCLLAAGRDAASPPPGPGPVSVSAPSAAAAAPATVLEEFSRCLQDIISAAHRPPETHA